jgi:hypothetical protein
MWCLKMNGVDLEITNGHIEPDDLIKSGMILAQLNTKYAVTNLQSELQPLVDLIKKSTGSALKWNLPQQLRAYSPSHIFELHRNDFRKMIKPHPYHTEYENIWMYMSQSLNKTFNCFNPKLLLVDDEKRVHKKSRFRDVYYHSIIDERQIIVLIDRWWSRYVVMVIIINPIYNDYSTGYRRDVPWTMVFSSVTAFFKYRKDIRYLIESIPGQSVDNWSTSDALLS